jgi:hypothetical protein
LALAKKRAPLLQEWPFDSNLKNYFDNPQAYEKLLGSWSYIDVLKPNAQKPRKELRYYVVSEGLPKQTYDWLGSTDLSFCRYDACATFTNREFTFFHTTSDRNGKGISESS